MKFFFGLGNFGKQYEKTRHNAGFLFLDSLIQEYSFEHVGKKFNSEVFSGSINGEKIICFKPQTYMNTSGDAVLSAMSFYKFTLSDCFVFYDELDLNVGEFRVKFATGTNGHNGARSIDKSAGKDYFRIKIGISRPKIGSVSDFVLNNFSNDELLLINECNRKILSKIDEIITLTPEKIDDFNKFFK